MRTASLSLFTILCLVLAVTPATAALVYSNGPYNGNTAAWEINFGFSVSDSYYPVGNGFTGLQFVYWDPVQGDVLTTVDVQLGTSPFEGYVYTYNAIYNIDLGHNQHGYELYLGRL